MSSPVAKPRAPRFRGLRKSAAGIGLLVLAVILFILIVYPVGMIIFASFTDNPPRPGGDPGVFTFDYYRSLLGPALSRAIGNSLIIGVGSTIGAVVVGGGLAWLGARSDMPFRSLATASGLIPLFVPALVGALAYDLISSPHMGYLAILLREFGLELPITMSSRSGMIFVMTIFYAPYAYLFLFAAFKSMNPEMEEAAAVHGGTTWQSMRNVTFPLAQPALLGATVITFVLVIENFTVPMILGTSGSVTTIPSLIYVYMLGPTPRHNQAASLGMVLMAMMVGAIWLQNRVMRGREYHTISGKGFRPAVIGLGRFRWVALTLVGIYFVLAAVVPVGVMILAALRKNSYVGALGDFFDSSQYTLDHFRTALTSSTAHTGAINSVIVGIFSAILGVALAFILSYLVNRTKVRGRQGFEFVAMMPAAIPSLLIGMGFLWTWLTLPVKLYGTLSILTLAYIARFLPQGFRGVTSTIRQMHPDLEDAARVNGANRLRALWHVTLPLMRAGIASAALLLFVLSVRELSTSIFLYTHKTRVLSIVIFQQWEGGRWPVMAAMSLLLALVLGVVAGFSRRAFDQAN